MGRLNAYTNADTFTGDYTVPAPSCDETLENRMAELYASKFTPRLSDDQIKAPMNLSHDSVLRPVRDWAFMHILKPSPDTGFEDLLSPEEHGFPRVAPDSGRNFSSTRFEPTYDSVTTRVFSGLENDQLALSLAGKRMSCGDFVRAGVTMGIGAEVARDCVESLCGRLGTHLENTESGSDRVDRAIEIWSNRIKITIG